MGIFAFVQTIWTTDMPVFGQIAKLDMTGGASPALVLHDPATQMQATLALGPGLLDPASVQLASVAGDDQSLMLEGQSRTLDRGTLARLGDDSDSVLAYMDGVGFVGNLAAVHRGDQ